MTDANIQYYFEVYFNRTATEEEIAVLMKLLRETTNDEALQSLIDNAWTTFSPGIQYWNEKEKADILFKIRQQIKKQRGVERKLRKWNQISVAAAIISVIIISAFYWQSELKRKPQSVAIKPSSRSGQTIITHGKDKALLTLQNGECIDVNSLKNDTSLYGFQKRSNNELVFTTDNSREIQYNTLSIPQGVKYKVSLPDGSRVWLNAASSLSFPTAFTGKKRHVTLTGEAYFEIAKNFKMPFIVTVNNTTIEVLGTHFNIMAYNNEEGISTTLLEGRVKITHGTRERLLKPGQQYMLLKNGTSKVSNADIREVMAWKNDLFVFKKYDFQKIMRQIERWYNVTVVYKGAVPSGKYSGIIERNNNISEVLEILKESGARFTIEKKTILIY